MKKNHVWLAATAGLIMLSSCASRSNSETADVPELTDDRCQELVAAIPDHQSVNNPETTLSDEYYSTWKSAWEIPDGGLGDIGNNEFLWYFVCGSDPCESHSGIVLSKEVDGTDATVKFNIKHRYEYPDTTTHTLKLTLEDGNWVIADYDNTLNEMKEYIVSQRKYIQSDEYRKAAEDILNDDGADEDWKEAVRNELRNVEEYLKKTEDAKE